MSGKTKLLVVVLLLAVTIVGCSSNENSNTYTYTISGTVSSSDTGLQGVIVTLSEARSATVTTDASENYTFQYITDASGNYTFQNLTSGSYTITPTRTGYTFSPSSLTSVINEANAVDQMFVVTANTALSCTAGHGSGTNGIQFYDYGGIFAQNSTATADATETATLTWQVQYQDILAFPGSKYSGSLRARLWAVPFSVSSGVFDNAYVIGVFYPNFTGTGAYSSNQLYVGYSSAIMVTSSAADQNPPAAEYCMVVTLEEYNDNSVNCSSPDHYCVNDWWQSGNSWIFY